MTTPERSIYAAAAWVAAARALRDETLARVTRRRGPAGGGPRLTLEWLDGSALFKPQDEGELAYSSGVLLEQVAEVL